MTCWPARDADANLCLVHEREGTIAGFARAKTGIPAPPVYAPGGTTCFTLELSGEAERLDARGYCHPVDWYHRTLL